jgi:hypothetical protein
VILEEGEGGVNLASGVPRRGDRAAFTRAALPRRRGAASAREAVRMRPGAAAASPARALLEAPAVSGPLPAALRRLWLAAALALLAAAAARPAPAPEDPISWRSRAALPGMRDAEALAVDAASGRVAVGDARGVWLVAGEGAPRRILGRGPVRDLLFRPGGELLAATDRGLHAIGADGRARTLRLGGGASSRARRLAAVGSAVAVGTEAGVFFARDGAAFARLDAGLPGGALAALALRPRDGGLELWAASEGALQRAVVAKGGTDLRVLEVQTPAIADGPGAREAVDVAVELGGADVVVLSPEHVALLRGGSWRSVPLQLPAGARARRLGAGAGRLWIATDGGVVEAQAWEGPWRRAAPPAGTAAALALAGDAARVLAVGARGLLEGSAAGEPAGEGPGSEGALAPDDYRLRLRSEPSIQQVHAAALRWLVLGPERMRSLERGVDRRAWLPALEIRGGAGRGRHRRWLEDQAQSSGSVFDLFDRETDRGSDYEAAVVLEWSLGDLVFNPDALDVSKEAREVIELRDEVLDEVTQLYFERRRVLLGLRAAGVEAEERARLRLRADELAAGLDAWTGGFFSHHALPLAAVVPEASPPPSAGGSAP